MNIYVSVKGNNEVIVNIAFENIINKIKNNKNNYIQISKTYIMFYDHLLNCFFVYLNNCIFWIQYRFTYTNHVCDLHFWSVLFLLLYNSDDF